MYCTINGIMKRKFRIILVDHTMKRDVRVSPLDLSIQGDLFGLLPPPAYCDISRGEL